MTDRLLRPGGARVLEGGNHPFLKGKALGTKFRGGYNFLRGLTLPGGSILKMHRMWGGSKYYCQTQKTVNAWKFSGMLIVFWPITIKFRIGKQTSKPQTNYQCCLRFSYLTPHWLISRITITFHKYFWYSRFYELHSKTQDWPSVAKCRGSWVEVLGRRCGCG